MSGIFVAASRNGTALRSRAILDALVTGTQETELAEPTPGLAIGRCDRFRLRTRPRLKAAEGGIFVAIDGDLLDSDAPMQNVVQFVADLYRRDQLDRLSQANGSFAVAILDSRTQRIVLASDRLGTRPLYLWQGAGGFIAASRLTAVLADGRPRPQISFQGLAQIVALQRPLADYTLYSGISSLVGSEIAVFEAGQFSRRRSWRPRWRSATRPVDDIAAEYAAGLRRAVSARLTDVERPGLLLSGGLDSRLVLAAAAAEGKPIACISAVPAENRELRIARQAAAIAGQKFDARRVDISAIVASYQDAALAMEGLYPAPINLYALWPDLSHQYDLLLHGYAIDYTIRGLYLPKRQFMKAKWPSLRVVPGCDPGTILANMTIGDRSQVWRRAVLPGRQTDWEDALCSGIEQVVSLCDLGSAHDAWDTLAIAPQCRHYTSSALIGMDMHIDHRIVGLDQDLVDLYFSMPANWRAADLVAHRALRILSPELARLPNANTNMPAGMAPWLQTSLALVSAATARSSRAFRKRARSVLTEGSWVNHAELFRSAPELQQRLLRLPQAEAIQNLGIFSAKELAAIVDEHLSGRCDHMKFLHSLASLETWLQRHPYSGIG